MNPKDADDDGMNLAHLIFIIMVYVMVIEIMTIILGLFLVITGALSAILLFKMIAVLVITIVILGVLMLLSLRM